jgi:hypothetical protein
MASERQIAANRRNAKQSTGPRSSGGKARSCRNALRHGLSIPSGRIQGLSQDVVELALALSPPGLDCGDAALIAAEAEIDLLRIRKYRAALVEQSRSDAELLELSEKLNRLERYDRLAFSRRKKALRAIEG